MPLDRDLALCVLFLRMPLAVAGDRLATLHYAAGASMAGGVWLPRRRSAASAAHLNESVLNSLLPIRPVQGKAARQQGPRPAWCVCVARQVRMSAPVTTRRAPGARLSTTRFQRKTKTAKNQVSSTGPGVR